MRRQIVGILAALLGACSPGPEPVRTDTVRITPVSPDWATRPTLFYSGPLADTTVPFDLVRLPGGRFKTGSPGNDLVREANIKPFWIGKSEVTWGEFIFYYVCPDADVDGRSAPSWSPLGIYLLRDLRHEFLEPRNPVVFLRWHSAMAYCRWLSRKTGHLFRLPTEVEWEYACRAGSDPPPPGRLAEYAWFGGGYGGCTGEVGGKKPNAFGLHDMLGNAWEYCLEPHQPPDFVPVLRGGGWDSPAADLGAECRRPLDGRWFEGEVRRPRCLWWLPGGRSLGFRLVRAADASDSREREAYASKIGIAVQKHEEKTVRIGSVEEPFVRVRGEVRNSGDRTLDELHIMVFFLNPKGRPHPADITADWEVRQRPTFNYGFPVLAHSAHPGEHRAPLKPGQTRAFTVDVPQTYDEPEYVCRDRFGARVAGLVFARD